MSIHRMKTRLAVLGLFGLAAAGCMGGTPDDAAVTGSGLVEVAPGTEPLDSVDSDGWQDAPGCHDRIGTSVHFEIAGAGLIAAVDASGDVLCVDSVEDVQDELEDDGRAEDAAALGDAYLVAVGLGYVPRTGDIAAGDPAPQPSLPQADPAPQPSMQ